MNLLILMVFLLASCNKNIKNLFDRNTTTKLVVNEVNFDFLSAKAKVNFDGEKDYSLSANFRMQKDSVIWLSLSPGLGVEVARVMITRDSISVLDKLSKDYNKIDYGTISKKYDFDINFNLIQSVILGNLIFPLAIFSSALWMKTIFQSRLLSSLTSSPVVSMDGGDTFLCKSNKV